MSLCRVTRGIPAFNIQIGPMMKAVGCNPSAILSVTDSFDSSLMQFPMFHWIPVNEVGKSWGYMPFYATKKILDFWCIDLQLPLVYLCCSAGRHRSPMMAFCWLLSRGFTPESVTTQFYGTFESVLLDNYNTDVRLGYIPPNLTELYKEMDRNPGLPYRDILNGILKSERITYI